MSQSYTRQDDASKACPCNKHGNRLQPYWQDTHQRGFACKRTKQLVTLLLEAALGHAVYDDKRSGYAQYRQAVRDRYRGLSE